MKKVLVGSLPNMIPSEFLSQQEDRSIQEKDYREIAEEVNDSLLARLGCLKGLQTLFLYFPEIQILEVFNVILRSFL